MLQPSPVDLPPSRPHASPSRGAVPPQCGWCGSVMRRKPTGISRRSTIVCRPCVEKFLARSKDECQRQWR